jgi:hypothetical protein
MPRDDGRLEGVLVSLGAVTAMAVILAGPFATAERLEEASPQHCEQITVLHTNSVTQAMALAAALIALRKFSRNGGRPPE